MTDRSIQLTLEANAQFGDGGGSPPLEPVTFRVIGMPNGESVTVVRAPDVGGWRINRTGVPWGPGYAEPEDALGALQALVDHAPRIGACPECRQAGRQGGDLEWVWTGREPWLQGLGVALGGVIPEGRSGYLWRCQNEFCTYSEGFTPA